MHGWILSVSGRSVCQSVAGRELALLLGVRIHIMYVSIGLSLECAQFLQKRVRESSV